MSDSNPLAELLLDPEHVYLLDDADFDAFTLQLNRARASRNLSIMTRFNPVFEPLDLDNAHVIHWKWHLQDGRGIHWALIRHVSWIDGY